MTLSKTPRFHFIDALRGIAAASVVLHHLFFASVMTTVYETVSPYFVNVLFRAGANGVEIFFVLSGFVIAHSLRNNSLSPSDLGRFIVRRQVRLDPPYWAAILIGLVALWVRNHSPGVQIIALPTVGELALNATYLQELFRLPQNNIVLEVGWTLCLEIQFYLLFIAILWLSHDTPRRPSSSEGDYGSAIVTNRAIMLMWLSGIACLVVRHFVVDAAYFWVAWHYFAAGVLAYWAVTHKASGFWIASLLGVFVLSLGMTWFSSPIHRGHYINSSTPLALLVGGGTAALLWQLGTRGKLDIWGNVRPLQYLGRISYSLYLTHMIVVLMVLRLGYKITKSNVPAAFLWMLVAGALSIGVAHLFYLLIERPSQRWTTAISKREAMPSLPTTATTTEPAL